MDFYRDVFQKLKKINISQKIVTNSNYIKLEKKRHLDSQLKYYLNNNLFEKFLFSNYENDYSSEKIIKDTNQVYLKIHESINIKKPHKDYLNTDKHLRVLENKNLIYSGYLLSKASFTRNKKYIGNHNTSVIKNNKSLDKRYIRNYGNDTLEESTKISNRNHTYTINRLFSIMSNLQKMISSNNYSVNKAENNFVNKLFGAKKSFKYTAFILGGLQNIDNKYIIDNVNLDTNISSNYNSFRKLNENSLINKAYMKNIIPVEKQMEMNTYNTDEQFTSQFHIYLNNYIQNMFRATKDSFKVLIENKRNLSFINGSYFNKSVREMSLDSINNNYQYYDKKTVNKQWMLESVLWSTINKRTINFIRRKEITNKDENNKKMLSIDNDIHTSNSYSLYDLFSDTTEIFTRNDFLNRDWFRFITNRNYDSTEIEKSNITSSKATIKTLVNNLSELKSESKVATYTQNVNKTLINSLRSFVENRNFIESIVPINTYSKIHIDRQDKDYVDKSTREEKDKQQVIVNDRDVQNIELTYRYSFKSDRNIKENISSKDSMTNTEKIEFKNTIKNNDADIMQNITSINTDSGDIEHDDIQDKELDANKLFEKMYQDIYTKIEKRLLSEKRRLGL